MKEILISGSTAYDTLLQFHGDFAENFVWESLDWFFNTSLLCDKHERFLWWTGLNIAYNLSLLGENSVLLSSAGTDFFEDSVISDRINMKYFHRDTKRITSGSIIVSDNSGHKLTFFHPGSMLEADQTSVSYVRETIGLAIVSANHIPAMLEHARELKSKGVPFFIDPAQQVTALNKSELIELLELGTYLIANEFEFQEIQEKSWYDEYILWNMFERIIITHGSGSLEMRNKKDREHISVISVDDIEDTTGAWDALRAGLLKWCIEWHNWTVACQIWLVMASYCIQVEWAQNHHVSLWNISQDMKSYYWVEIDLHNKRKY